MPRMISEVELAVECDALLDAVEQGDVVTVTRNGRTVAELRPVARRRDGVPTDELQRLFSLLPRMDYATLRAGIDEFFGDDDRIREEDYE